MANPARPRSLTDVISDLIQSQDDAGEQGDTALYDAVYDAETVLTSDAVTLTDHAPQYVTQEQGIESGATARNASFGEYFSNTLACLIAEATTNLVTNVYTWNLWALAEGSATIAEGGDTVFGHLAALISATGAGNTRHTMKPPDMTASAGATYTAAGYAKAGASARFVIEDRGDAVTHQCVYNLSNGTSSNLNCTSIIVAAPWIGVGWYLCIMTFTRTNAGSMTMSVGPCNAAGSVSYVQTGETVYFAAPQTEAKAYATPFANGSLGTGFTWTGAANASTSTRTAGRVQLAPTLNGTTGSMVVAFVLPWAAGHSPGDATIMIAVNGSNRLHLYYRDSAGGNPDKYALRRFDGTHDTTIVSATQTHAAGAAIMIAIQWSATTLTMNVLAQTQVTGADAGNVPNLSAANIDVGSNGGAGQINGPMALVLASSTAAISGANVTSLLALTALPTWNQIVASMINLWYGDTTKADAYSGKALTYG